jgi:hypothetical protein
MILRLKTNTYAPELLSILDLVSGLIGILATCRTAVLDETALAAAVPEPSWLLHRLRNHIVELLENTTQAERGQLLDAVNNDRQFDVNIDSQSFRLQYPGLPTHVREHSTALLCAFYDTLLEKGFPITRSNGSTVIVDRKLLEQGFFERNYEIRTCPACLEVEIAPTGANVATTNDCDHFLPKFIYGPLAIHPQNLVFICMPCNQRRKGKRDPLTGPGTAEAETLRRTRAGALRMSYLPYRRAAWPELKIGFTREGVTLGADSDDADERVANLNRTFQLDRVWRDVLPRAEREMFEQLKTPPTTKAVKSILDDTEARGGGEPEQLKQGVFLRARYAAHLRDEQLAVLTKEWQLKSAERRKSAALYSGKPPTTR